MNKNSLKALEILMIVVVVLWAIICAANLINTGSILPI